MDSAGAQLTGQPSVDEQVHIVSWNVAGWKSTVEQLRRFNGGVSSFMDKHHIDILCLQEVKLMSKTIEADATKLNVNVPGFESFWACNEGSGGQRQGFNGVATFVRQGLVLRADAAPLKDPALDAEGRCLLTDHGSFALFNVYVPNTSDASRLPYKLRWLRALKEAMRRTRSAGKGVILVGDLNMKHRVSDSHWVSRTINVPRLMQLSPECSALQPDVQKAIDTICREWPNMCAALRQKEHRYFETKRHGQTFQRWGVFAKDQSGQSVRVGSPCECEDSARRSYCVDGVGVGQDGTVICGPDQGFLRWREGVHNGVFKTRTFCLLLDSGRLLTCSRLWSSARPILQLARFWRKHAHFGAGNPLRGWSLLSSWPECARAG